MTPGPEAHIRRCAVTGANGFVGSNVVRELLERGIDTVALVGADLDRENLAGLPVKIREIDLLDPEGIRRAVADCDGIVHSAASYAFWARDPAHFYRVNVEGTRNVLDAARSVGATRVVHTSSTATLSPGLDVGPQDVGDEEAVLDLRRFRGHYKMSKMMAEVVALRAAALGLPLCIVHPTEVLGPGDRRPTPTGAMIVHFLCGRLVVYVDMPHNLVDVEDVARGHVLALLHGVPGERYVLGGENLPMPDILAVLAEITGMPAPRFALPRFLLGLVGRVSDTWADLVSHREPMATAEASLHARDARAVDGSKARVALGFEARPTREALVRSVRWFLDEGRCSVRRRASIEANLQRAERALAR
jgi:dihydroflavonol-4-reductase